METEKMIVNGKHYPLWSQFVERKEEWVGGELQELCDSYPFGEYNEENKSTKIKDIRLYANGDNAFFSVDGEEYGCGGSTEFLGIIAGEEGWITLSGYGGHTWRIRKPQKLNSDKNDERIVETDAK